MHSVLNTLVSKTTDLRVFVRADADTLLHTSPSPFVFSDHSLW